MTILFFLSVSINVILFLVALKFTLKAKEFDDITERMIEDTGIFADYLHEGLSQEMLIDSPQLRALNNNMRTMYERFIQYIEDAGALQNVSRPGRLLREQVDEQVEGIKNYNPPVAVD